MIYLSVVGTQLIRVAFSGLGTTRAVLMSAALEVKLTAAPWECRVGRVNSGTGHLTIPAVDFKAQERYLLATIASQRSVYEPSD
jgi:hypothetical protein